MTSRTVPSRLILVVCAMLVCLLAFHGAQAWAAAKKSAAGAKKIPQQTKKKAVKPPPPPRDFSSALARFQATAGDVAAHVVSLPGGHVVWEHQSQKPMVTASLMKVLTSYAALMELGPYYHFRTGVWSPAEPKNGVVHGNVYVKGSGDPLLTADRAWSLAQRLRDAGVRRIEGSVLVDNSYFNPESERLCLDGKCDRPYNPTVSATAIDFNTMTVRVHPGDAPGAPAQVAVFPPGDYVEIENLAKTGPKGSLANLPIGPTGNGENGPEHVQVKGQVPVTGTEGYEMSLNVRNADAYNSRAFRALFRQAGIEVTGQGAGAEKAPPGSHLLARYESPPLCDLLYGLNRYSNNFMAEMLLRSVGASALGAPGTVEKGVEATRRILGELGVTPQELDLDSGSGLSRECRASARAFGKVLIEGHDDFSIAPEFLASLATNGAEGTLRKRMKRVRPGLTIRGKTGTLRNAIGFAGYVSDSSGNTFGVVVLLNEVKNLFEARKAIDDLLGELTQFAPRG